MFGIEVASFKTPGTPHDYLSRNNTPCERLTGKKFDEDRFRVCEIDCKVHQNEQQRVACATYHPCAKRGNSVSNKMIALFCTSSFGVHLAHARQRKPSIPCNTQPRRKRFKSRTGSGSTECGDDEDTSGMKKTRLSLIMRTYLKIIFITRIFEVAISRAWMTNISSFSATSTSGVLADVDLEPFKRF